jgi:uncharacterized protein (DUF433 family)
MTDDTLIVSDPDILGGTPCIAGTRLPVYAVAARFKAGESAESILDGYDDLTIEHIRAAVAYADAYPFVEDQDGRPWRRRRQQQAAE